MRRSLRDSAVLFISAAVLAACSAATQRAYVAPTFDTILSSTEERNTDQPAFLIWIENRSTVPVTVFSISLRGCENVKQRCEARPVNLHVAPGQRELATRVEPENPARGYRYLFNFAWRADSSSTVVLRAMANAGDAKAGDRAAAIQRADSIRRVDIGAQYTELSRDDFKAIAARAASIRAEPDSLIIAPGERSSIDRIRLLVLDDRGAVLGRTRWVRWSVSSQSAVQFVPPYDLVARAPGRMIIRLMLAEDAQKLLTHPIAEIEVPVVAAFPPDPYAPFFTGQAVDADSKTPLPCARVALEDSAQNVVTSDRTGATGTFTLQAPRPGTYRVRVEVPGWVPAYGPTEVAKENEEKQHEYLVRFTEQLLVTRDMDLADVRHAQPVAVATEPIGSRSGAKRGKAGAASTPLIQGVTLGGSASMPVLGIIGGVAPTTTWIQFAVDSTGHVDTTSIMVPAGSAEGVRTSVTSVLSRIRFSPARDAGKPACEMLRMQVNFTPAAPARSRP